MSEKSINQIKTPQEIVSNELEASTSFDKKIQKVADFITRAALKDPEPIVFHGKDGAPDTVVENRGGLWRL